jgi:hypothetical protein
MRDLHPFDAAVYAAILDCYDSNPVSRNATAWHDERV